MRTQTRNKKNRLEMRKQTKNEKVDENDKAVEKKKIDYTHK